MQSPWGYGSNRGAVYVLLLNANGTAKSSTKIASSIGGGPTLAGGDFFGSSVTSLGDLDGDGIADLAVGATGDDTGGIGRGAVHVLLLNADGTVKTSTKIASGTNGGPTLSGGSGFGRSVTSVGDVDLDGVVDLAVGTGGSIHTLLLNANGSVKTAIRITSDDDDFGRSLASVGDLDGDGVPDLAAGGTFDEGYYRREAVHVLLLNRNGTAKSWTRIGGMVGGGPPLERSDYFGVSVTSVGDLDGDGRTDLAVGAPHDDTAGQERGAVYILSLNPLLDFGDAPDTSSGTGSRDYQTTAANGGPSHRVEPGLYLGNKIDGDDGTLQSDLADADDLEIFPNSFLPNDEDGVLDPYQDLIGRVGAIPIVTLLVTNNTGRTAVLAGWIDYNQNGVFDNATERALASISSGAIDQRITLTFPAIPDVSEGRTYARFRLSTDKFYRLDPSAIGEVSGGEVEDYVFTITSPRGGAVDDFLKIAHELNGGPTLSDRAEFGRSVTVVGDVDGNGVPDLAVGSAERDCNCLSVEGEVHVLLMNADGTVKNFARIGNGTGGGPLVFVGDSFGHSVAGLGDLDGDGVPDLAVGAPGADAVYVLFLNRDGTAKTLTKIASNTGGGPTLGSYDSFGLSLANMGDLDGDGVTDLVVGQSRDYDFPKARGAVHVLLLNTNGTVKDSSKISGGAFEIPFQITSEEFLGFSAANAGDLDGNGVTDLVVGAPFANSGGLDRGAVHVLLLNSDRTVKSSTLIANGTGGGPTLVDDEHFGYSVAGVGDLDGDGVSDLAVGAPSDPFDYANRHGSVYLLLMNADGTVKSSSRIPSGTDRGPTLGVIDRFGWSLASGDLNHDGVTDLAVGAIWDSTGGPDRGAVHLLALATRRDYGDAPDAVAGTARGNYRTTADDGGPSHTIVTGLYLGYGVDGDPGTRQNSAANADDTGGADRDDEDGVLNPLDLRGTIGTAPTVTLLVTNNTGKVATLSGWIDYNQNGAFENTTELALATINTGTTRQRVTLEFPAVPENSVGVTYARFRLTTDIRLTTDGTGQSSIGARSDGEVEDYVFSITAPSSGTVDHMLKIASNTNGGPALVNGNYFGRSVAAIGDLDGDGVTDLAIGAPVDFYGGSNDRAVYVLLMNSNGTVKSSTRIASGINGGPTVGSGDEFGSSLAAIGDLDGDGVADLAVGNLPSGADLRRGEVHILLLNADGTAKSSTTIASNRNGGPSLDPDDRFGSSITTVGDLNGDGVVDLAVGASGDDTGGENRGAVYLLFLRADGTGKYSTKIASGTGPVLEDRDLFGSSVANVGDLDGDGIVDLAVGAEGDRKIPEGAFFHYHGAIHVLLLKADGMVKSSTRIASRTNGGPEILPFDFFGRSLASVGDLDGDGVPDLAVGAPGDDYGVADSGALYVLFMNTNGAVKSSTRIGRESNGAPALGSHDQFGSAVTSLGDIDGDGWIDLAVGANGDDTGGSRRGAVHLLFLKAADSSVLTLTVNIVDASLNDSDPSSSVTFEFSEAVNGFEADDVSVTNGTLLSNFQAVDADSFTATFTANDGISGTGSVSVGTGYTDAAGNSGTAGSDNVSIDTLNPMVTVNIVDASLNDGDNSSVVTFEFSEAVSGFDVNDVSVSGGMLSNFVAGDADSFTATFTANDNFAGTGSVSVGTGYTDAAGNSGTAGSDTVSIDTQDDEVGFGNVKASVSRGKATITGDKFANNVTIFIDSNGNTVIQGRGETTINGKQTTFVLLPAGSSLLTQLTVKLLQGDDRLVIGDMELGTLTIDTSSGADQVFLAGVTTSKSMTIKNSSGQDDRRLDDVLIGRDLVVTGSGLLAVQNSEIGRKLTVTGGTLDDAVLIQQTLVRGTTSINTKSGRGTVVLDHSEFADDVKVTGGKSDDLLALIGSTFGDRLTISASSGADRIALEQGNVVNGKVTLDGSSGEDILVQDGTTEFSSTPKRVKLELDSDDSVLPDIDAVLSQFDELELV